jgi:UDP-N-acetyl-D-mannosaminuronic acid dehydrogenase
MSKAFQTVAMIGLGYIGLPTAAMLAARKVKVIGVDINPHAVETINKGQIHIVEPELDMIVSAAVSQGYLRATTKPEPADAYLIAVPTPFKHLPSPPGRGDGGEGSIPEPDLVYVEAAAKSIAPVLKKGDLVILESTSPVGTTEQMAGWLAEARPDLTFPQQVGDAADINIAYCPERVLPGKVVHELVNNDRVIGGMTKTCSRRAIALYKTFVEAECIETNARTAEMCKLTENSFRDVNIAFANELSLICDELGINVWELIRLANRHPRVNILQPGPGVGGHCIAVDPWFIVHSNPNTARLIRTAREVNDHKPHWVMEKVKLALADYLQQHPGKTASDVTIACFGLAFKPDIDDLRESPAMEITRALAEEHPGPVLAVEPNIHSRPQALPQKVSLVTLEEALRQAQIAVLLVAHKPFRETERSAWETLRYVDACGILRG